MKTSPFIKFQRGVIEERKAHMKAPILGTMPPHTRARPPPFCLSRAHTTTHTQPARTPTTHTHDPCTLTCTHRLGGPPPPYHQSQRTILATAHRQSHGGL